MHDGLVDVRIELGAERVDRLHAVAAQEIVQLAVNQLDALAVRGAAFAGVDGHRAIEIVNHREQVLQQIDDGLIGLLAALAFDALAVIVELGALAEPAILVVVALALQLGGIGGRRRRFRRVGHRFISHTSKLSPRECQFGSRSILETACAAPSTAAIARE